MKDLFDILKKDEKKLQINTGRGIADYFPTKKFRITVDPATAVRTGTVPPEMADKITNLEWRYNGSAITKNYLMMLDLLAHNNWERPVYYVATTGPDAYIGLENYLKLEGFAYRLIPIPRAEQKNELGEVNTTVMYDNLMNKFVFDIRKPGFLISEDIYRMTITMRNTYARCAESLAAENRLDEAVQVCDRIQELIPDRIVPYNFFNLGIGETYLKAGQTEKGLEILNRLIAISDEQLAYFFRFPADKTPYLDADLQQNLAVLHAIGRAGEDFGQEELAAEATETFDLYYNLYLGQAGGR